MLMALSVSIICLLYAYPIAYLIAKHGGRYRLILVLLTATPFLTGIILRVTSIQHILGGILNDGESTVIVKTTGNYGDISGNLVLIDATTDEIIKTIDLKMTPGSFAINSQKQIYLQGGWPNRGLLVYDIPTQEWIRDKNDRLELTDQEELAPAKC